MLSQDSAREGSEPDAVEGSRFLRHGHRAGEQCFFGTLTTARMMQFAGRLDF
jgi:hypothetical protein